MKNVICYSIIWFIYGGGVLISAEEFACWDNTPFNMPFFLKLSGIGWFAGSFIFLACAVAARRVRNRRARERREGN